jgi:hypothetical protein
MRFPSSNALFCAAIGAGLVAGCSGVTSQNGSLMPGNTAAQSSRHVPFQRFRAPVALETPPIHHGPWVRPSWYRDAPPGETIRGIYVSQFNGAAILGYHPRINRNNDAPVCSEPASFVNDVGSDKEGNMIQPDGGSLSVIVYAGPSLCGAELGSFPDNDGQPSGATSSNAATDTIYVTNILATSQTFGNISVCTLAGGCTATLSNPAINDYAYSVAKDKAGNVYLAGRVLISSPSTYGAALVLFKGGKGAGTVITSYVNAYPGGLDFDRDGNLTAIDAHANGVGALFVYSGCPDACTPHGPWPLQGESVFGKVSRTNERFFVGNFINGTVDVYSYKGLKGIKYLYSFNNSLTVSGDVHGIALDRASQR